MSVSRRHFVTMVQQICSTNIAVGRRDVGVVDTPDIPTQRAVETCGSPVIHVRDGRSREGATRLCFTESPQTCHDVQLLTSRLVYLYSVSLQASQCILMTFAMVGSQRTRRSIQPGTSMMADTSSQIFGDL